MKSISVGYHKILFFVLDQVKDFFYTDNESLFYDKYETLYMLW